MLNKRPPQVAQLGVTAQDDPLEALPLVRDMLKLVDTGRGVLILTDIYGATPSNLAMKLLEPGRVCLLYTSYQEYGIESEPFVIVKADAGTYGMGIMTVKDASEVKNLNRKQRNKMAVVKEGMAVTEVDVYKRQVQ